MNEFQFTPARGGRPTRRERRGRQTSFNSRPRVAGDGDPCHAHNLTIVSIHARAWRATRVCGGCARSHCVSIHARAWRATCAARAYPSTPCSFNSRPRVAGDQPFLLSISIPQGFNSRPRVAGDMGEEQRGEVPEVSIHARAWRATPRPSRRSRSCTRFNSRPRVAGDTRRSTSARRSTQFQFTPARGGRQSASESASARGHSFNSRPRVAGDTHIRRNATCHVSFNSRPRVAGDPIVEPSELSCRFQFTPARGGRPQKIVSFLFAEALQKACNADSISFSP